MNHRRKNSICRTLSSDLNLSNASVLLVPCLIIFSLLIACSGTPGATGEAGRTGVAAATMPVTMEPTVTATATAIPSATATQMPTVTPSQTPTPKPTETSTPTTTPLPTFTPTPNPGVEYLTLIGEFIEGSVEIQNVIFQDDISDESLDFYEELLVEVTTTSQVISEFDYPWPNLPELRSLIMETIDICTTANEGMVAIARHRNATGRMLSGEADVFEVFEATNSCQDEMIPQFLEAISVEN